VNAALALLASLVLPSGRRWGEAAEAFQWEAASHMLSERADPPYRFETRPRGGSKTSDAGGVVIADLVEAAPARSRSYGVAADAEQAGLLIDAIGGFVSRSSELGEVLRVETRRVVNLINGATVAVVPADEASAYGLTPRMVIADELSVWPSTKKAKGVWAAMISALPKVPDSRLWVICSAGDPAHWSYKVLDEARSSPHWTVAEIAGPVPWIDATDLEAQRSMLLPSQYARLHENRWIGGEDRLVTPEALREAIVLDGPQRPIYGVDYVAGIDVGLRHDPTAIAVAHSEPIEVRETHERQPERPRDRRVVLDRMIVIRPPKGGEVQLQAVEDAVVEVHQQFRLARAVFDPWQAIGLAQRLHNRGVPVEEFTMSQASNARLTGVLYHLLSDRLLALPDDADLVDELANIRLREQSPGMAPKMEHDAGRHNDQTIALALAAHSLVKDPVPYAGPIRMHDARACSRGGRGVCPICSGIKRERGADKLRRLGEAGYIQDAIARARRGPRTPTR
jgi:phage terminase large subunit-like protein